MPSSPIPDHPVDRTLYIEQQAKAADSVREQESSFVKGALKGVGASVVSGLAAIGEFVDPTGRSKGLTEALDWYMKSKLLGDNPKPGEASGYSFGNVTGTFIDPFKAIGAGKALLVPLSVANKLQDARKIEVAGEVLANIDYRQVPLDMSIFDTVKMHGSVPIVPLRQVLHNPTLDQLDELKGLQDKVLVELADDLPSRTAGQMQTVRDSKGEVSKYIIRLNEDIAKKASPTLVKQWIVHELQHATQLEVNMRSLGTNTEAVKKKIKLLLNVNDPKKLDRPTEEELNRAANALYQSNIGEIEARAAEYLAVDKPLERPIDPRFHWDGMTLDQVWAAYKNFMAEIRKPENLVK